MDQHRPITSRSDRLSIIVIFFAVALGLCLRCWKLSGPSLWFDEGYTAWLADHSCSEIIRLVRADTAPPLYYLLLHGWMEILGTSELALRSFSCTCAVVTLVIVHAICRQQKFSLLQIAVVLSLLSMSVLQVRYARDARCYALVSLFAAAQLYGVLAFRESRSVLHAVPFILSSAAMLYTHNMTLVYIAAMLGGWVILGDGPLRHRIAESTTATAAIGLLYLPWISSLMHQVRAVSSGFWIPRPGIPELLQTLQVILGLREDFAGNAAAPVSRWIDDLSILAVIVFLAIVTIATLKKDSRIRLIACYALCPVMIVFLYSLLRTPLLIDRAFMPSSIAVCLLAGLLISHVESLAGRAIVPVILMLAGVSSVGYIGFEQKEDWRSAIRYVDSIRMRHPRTLVFLANEGELLHRYYARNSTARVTGLPMRFLDTDTPRAMQRVEKSQDLTPLYKIIEDPHSAEIDLIVSHGGRDKNKQAIRLLNETCRLIDKRSFPNITVYRFAVDEDLVARGE